VKTPARHGALRRDTFGNESPSTRGLKSAVERKNGNIQERLGDQGGLFNNKVQAQRIQSSNAEAVQSIVHRRYQKNKRVWSV